MPNPFDWGYLTSPPDSTNVLNAFSIIYLLVFLSGFVIASYVYYRPWTQPFGRLYRRTTVKRACTIAMWVFGAGLFFFLIRIVQINPLTLGQPIWMWLSIVALVAMIIWFAYVARNEPRPAAIVGPGGHTRHGAPHVSPTKRPVRRDRTTR